MSRRFLLLIAAFTLAGVSSSFAQNFNLAPTFGQVSLNAGFAPDPYAVNLVAGGNISATGALGGSCEGLIANAPDFRTFYSAGGFPLIFSVLSSTDTTLVINDPNGNWYCDDDSGGSLNPIVHFNNPLSGKYDVWVGTFGGGTANATLRISELGGGTPAPQPTQGPNLGLAPTFGQVSLNAGFAPDPYRVGLVAGGNISAAGALGGSCEGLIAEAPDFQLFYSAGGFTLYLAAVSARDTNAGHQRSQWQLVLR